MKNQEEKDLQRKNKEEKEAANFSEEEILQDKLFIEKLKEKT